MFYGFVRLCELLFVPLKTLDLDQTLDETKEKTQKLQYSTEKIHELRDLRSRVH